MPLKQGVRIHGIRPEIVFALAEAREVWARHGAPLVVTAGINGTHKPGSAHYSGSAVDLRTHVLDNPAAAVGELRAALGNDYDVLLEFPNSENQHCHIEWQPKTTY